MDLLNEARPAAYRALTGLSKSSGFPTTDTFEINLFPVDFQAKVLVDRYGLKPPTARAFAELMFGRAAV
ncbi:hypothetical protein EN868_11625 [Mesorhizobium sp. M2D.F.Ca.ET.225.01.1.1]|uniref:hypothetical protein n=1 Tax=unclassified Mesorhizobium TaxID=325217 RepID=UPI000FD3AA9A|nr:MULTISPECIES: hypothetical protein [unclassified Mesorhizobium]TGP55765.1 hypothetical protein EN869_025435 [Mesorhizobium sp. M2D.F.Ca.ET.226.01.1.1]TGP68223.1 hypothetical protein EN868_11625 [Mesorhizobium sp. M2D.F.Ca.ET.225.01.1.1]